MIPVSLDKLLTRRRTLMLQGPMGPFFSRLADSLRAHGQEVWKVHFNGGDEMFWRSEGALRFTDTPDIWWDRVNDLLLEHQIDALVLFGQTRVHHRVAMRAAEALGISVFVFEEGYLRPDYVTLELGGVNAESKLSRNPAFYRKLNVEQQPAPQPTGQRFRDTAGLAMAYALGLWAGRRRYPHYQHHRCVHPIREGLRWVRGYVRKCASRVAERHMQDFLAAPAQHQRYFLVPLQVHNDAQIHSHSRYGSVAEFIDEVLCSFAEHAAPDHLLVLKHHPLDRPYTDYRKLIKARAQALGLASRVMYLHDQHLPTLLQHARGVVTVNSTTGLQSLFHGTPVITLGDCLYAVEGLVNTGPLAQFWQSPGTVDMDLFRRFRSWMIRETQLNASFYAGTPGLPSSTESKRRRASSGEQPSAEAQASNWSSPTVPTLK
jgi:capsular polysaccharide export protein